MLCIDLVGLNSNIIINAKLCLTIEIKGMTKVGCTVRTTIKKLIIFPSFAA